MTQQAWLTVVGVIIAALASYGAARYAGKASVKVKEIDVDAAAYARAQVINNAAFERLDKEITALQKSHANQGTEIRQLRTDLDHVTKTFRISMNFIERFLLWARDGSKPPIPTIPDSLREHLDPSLIREHSRQQEYDR